MSQVARAERPCTLFGLYYVASRARASGGEEPGAGKAPAGICAGGAGQPTSLPRSRLTSALQAFLGGLGLANLLRQVAGAHDTRDHGSARVHSELGENPAQMRADGPHADFE